MELPSQRDAESKVPAPTGTNVNYSIEGLRMLPPVNRLLTFAALIYTRHLPDNQRATSHPLNSFYTVSDRALPLASPGQQRRKPANRHHS